MTNWTRVKDKETGHESSTAVVRDHHEVLDKPAVDRNGDPLPAKPNRPLATLTNRGGKTVPEMTVPELHDYARSNQIDLGEASRKEDILAAIAVHEQGDNTPAA
ncbi:hypothetical protein GCM10009616_35760 [Microlunatus lacustris]